MRRQKNEAEKRVSTDKGILHEPVSLEPKNVMFGTPRVALLKKERGCCKYDLILQQPLKSKGTRSRGKQNAPNAQHGA